MGVRQTHTYAELELSKAAYDEIAKKLRDAGYDHAFMEDGTIDMHGIGVTREVNEVDRATVELERRAGNAPLGILVTTRRTT